MAIMEIFPKTPGIACSLPVINGSVPHTQLLHEHTRQRELVTLPFLLAPEHFPLRDPALHHLLEHQKI